MMITQHSVVVMGMVVAVVVDKEGDEESSWCKDDFIKWHFY